MRNPYESANAKSSRVRCVSDVAVFGLSRPVKYVLWREEKCTTNIAVWCATFYCSKRILNPAVWYCMRLAVTASVRWHYVGAVQCILCISPWTDPRALRTQPHVIMHIRSLRHKRSLIARVCCCHWQCDVTQRNIRKLLSLAAVTSRRSFEFSAWRCWYHNIIVKSWCRL